MHYPLDTVNKLRLIDGSVDYSIKGIQNVCILEFITKIQVLHHYIANILKDKIFVDTYIAAV